MTRKILVCGTRSLQDYVLVKRTLDRLTRKLTKKFEIVTGACRTGADALAEKWADENWQRVACKKRFHADWERDGKQAGPIRNSEMIQYLGDKDVVVAFWDGKSHGTKDCIEKAKKRGLKVKIYKYQG